MRRDLAWFTTAALIALPAFAVAQQPRWPDPPGARPAQPPQWPDPPGARQPPPPGPAAPAAAPRGRKPPAQQTEPDPRFEEEPPPGGAAAAPRQKPAPRPAAALNILCDGPFGRDSGHDRLVKAFGARNVVAQGAAPGGGSTVLFPDDPKRRLEVTWREAAARSRPAAIVVEAQSTWRVRGFRLGEPLAQVEKVNGKAFRLAGFDGETGGAARDWQGGKLAKLSGGCLLGMRFAPDPSAPAQTRARTASGELTSNSPDVKAAKPTIIEMIVGYPE